MSQKYLVGRGLLRGISIGSGDGRIEREWAKAAEYELLEGIDLADETVRRANAAAQAEGLSRLVFRAGDATADAMPKGEYDVAFCWHSLHHLSPMLVAVDRIYESLKPSGLLIAFEYVGARRFQWTAAQLAEANRLLQAIPLRLRRRWGLRCYKQRIHRPGLLRMLLADPSEAAESDLMLGEIRRRFATVEFRNVPGTLLQLRKRGRTLLPPVVLLGDTGLALGETDFGGGCVEAEGDDEEAQG